MQSAACQVSLDFAARLLVFTLFSDAIELGQAEACVYCQKFAKNPGFSTCSKTCGALLSIERRMGGRVRGQGQAPPPPQPPPAPLVPPAPTSPSPTKNASKNEKNRARNESVYSCGCVIRILKMSPGGSVPNTCPVCPPPTRMESGAQTDSIDDPKTAGKLPNLIRYILSIRPLTMLLFLNSGWTNENTDTYCSQHCS